MQGVTVLNEFSIISERNWTVATAVGFIIIILVICAVGTIAVTSLGGIGYVLLLCAAILSIFGINSVIYFTTKPVYETHYQVIVDDSTSVVDFLNRYEVLEQQGNIFIVKEKN
jgi:Na+(H+)/acetate symporter ActP